jgi:hypothetical protein
MYRKIYAGKFRCPGWFSLGLHDLLRRVLHPSPDEEEEEAWFKAEFKEEEEEEDEGAAREMTTFDILSFSAGSDLSALLGAGPGKERVFVGEATGAVLSRVEAAGRKAGYRVRRGEEGRRRKHQHQHQQQQQQQQGGGGPVYLEEEGGGGIVAIGISDDRWGPPQNRGLNRYACWSWVTILSLHILKLGLQKRFGGLNLEAPLELLLLLHVMLLLQSLEDLEGERKRSKRGGVHQN